MQKDVDQKEEALIEEEENEAETIDKHIPAIEALIFVSGEPLSVNRIKEVMKLREAEVQDAIEYIEAKLQAPEYGFCLVKVAGGYQFRSKPEYSSHVRELKTGRPRRLTAAALETLAIVAYRQPIVRSDVEKIRGVDATPTIKTLLERGLIRIVGHQGTVGQPALYGTTDEFLKLFGLENLSQLPTLRDIKELEQDPGETEELGDLEEDSTPTETSDQDYENDDPEAENAQEIEDLSQEEPPLAANS